MKQPRKVRQALCLVASMFLIACVNNVGDEIRESNIPISFSTKINEASTKATDGVFDIGDKLGVFAMLSGNALDGQRYIDNLQLECGESTLIPKKEVFYPEGDATLDFVSYYPYQASGVEEGSKLLNISVQTDQSQSANYASSDFMTARTENVGNDVETVELEYTHKLTKINIVLVPQDGESAEELCAANPRIVATGFKTQAVYDLGDDKLSSLTDGSEKDIVPFGTWEVEKDCVVGKEFIVIPQTHSTPQQAFMLEWNGKIYACSLTTDAIKENTELEVRINALQSTSTSLTGIVYGINDWGTVATGSGENRYDITAVHTASFSFATSDVYRVYQKGKAVAEVCKEYLKSDAIAAKAIVVYPVQENEETDLTKGTVLQLVDVAEAVHGGTVSWNTADNTLNYVAGTSEPIEKFYIDGNSHIVFEKPSEALAINVSNYVIRDIRNGVLTTYPIVKVGTQYWMKENLKATYYNDNQSIPKMSELGAGDGYFELEANDYQILYNGEAVLTGKLAPEDWRVTTEADWDKLKAYVGGNASALKKADVWKTDSNPATDETGLSMPGSGLYLMRGQGVSTMINYKSAVAYWMYDASENVLEKVALLLYSNNNIDYSTTLHPAESNVTSDEQLEYYNGFSVRCVKE